MNSNKNNKICMSTHILVNIIISSIYKKYLTLYNYTYSIIIINILV